MTSRILRGWSQGVVLFSSLGMFSAAFAQPGIDFNRDIRPILSDRCFACHGPDANTRKGGLRLDEEAAAKEKVIVPGDPDASTLLKRVMTVDPLDQMPPPESEKPALSPEEQEIFSRWIEEGARWAAHWAFVKPVRPEPPQVTNGAWVRNEIDALVLAALETQGLGPSPEADRATLLRRAAFDITGIPPTPSELDAFLADSAPDAYERAVDRLFDSPRYGERMAIDWLDGARYADTNGYQNDFQRHMWPWRDWVIRAYNENMPFDQFALEQIAGDLLPNATDSQRVATGFNRNNRSNTEGGSIEAEWYVENRVDRVETTSGVFLGLTMGCARCHDHKYDPVSQKEFYKFYGFFNSTEDKGFYEETRGNTGPLVSLPTEENRERLADFDARIARAETRVAEERERLESAFTGWLEERAVKPPVFPGEAAVTLAQPCEDAAVAVSCREGLLGPSFELDGSEASHLDAGNAYAFSAAAPFSISIWVRPEGPGSLVSRMDDATAFRGVDLLLAENGQLAPHMVSAWPENAMKSVSEQRLQMGQWAHVVWTYDGSGKAAGMQLYINGAPATLKPEVDALSGPLETDQPLRIGRRSTSAFFKGGISSLRIYNEVLGAEQVLQLQDAALTAAAVRAMPEERRDYLKAFYLATNAGEVARLQARVDKWRKDKSEYEREKVPSVMVMKELPEPRPTYLLARGVYDAPDTSEALQPDVPAFLPPLPADAPRNRLALAQWIISPENPLTARVTVNRLWMKFFGRGLVKTPDNFGVQSEAPSHPELLDWLATELIQSGWNLKALQKKIVLSATYRQSSAVSDALLARDPENLLLARGPRFRLPAELIRDNALFAAGLLVERLGGPSVMPYQPEGLWDEIAGGAGQGPYVQAAGDDLYRRGLYTYRKRTVPHPLTSTFDAPSWEICRIYRTRTNTPLQALALLNDTTYVEAARHLAQRMIREGGPESYQRLQLGFRLATGRNPSEQETTLLENGLRKYFSTYAHTPDDAAVFVDAGESPVPEELDKVQLAAYTAVAGVILNLDETITKE